MTHGAVTYTLLVILSTSLLENAVAQSIGGHDLFNVMKEMASLTKKCENLKAKVEALQKTVEMQANLLSHFVTKEEVEIFSRNLEAAEEMQGTLVNSLVTKEDEQAKLLYKLQGNVTNIRAQIKNLRKEFQKSVRPEKTVEGIVAGTVDGVVVISLDSREQRSISRNQSTGVAFNWNTRKVYWIERNVGIKRAYLDGTSVELLVSDTSYLRGLAVDPITGNFYYGKYPPAQEIRVCGPSGKNCAVVASGADIVGKYINDIALHPSEGILFWSNPNQEKTVIRASMDGRNATVMISENTWGLDFDDESHRLNSVYYTNKNSSRGIFSYDLSGGTRKVLLNSTLIPTDVAVVGDTVYFGSYLGKSVHSITHDGQISLIANTTGEVRHIALYGRNKVPSRPNPCEHSPCPNVCVLNRDSFTCL